METVPFKEAVRICKTYCSRVQRPKLDASAPSSSTTPALLFPAPDTGFWSPASGERIAKDINDTLAESHRKWQAFRALSRPRNVSQPREEYEDRMSRESGCHELETAAKAYSTVAALDDNTWPGLADTMAPLLDPGKPTGDWIAQLALAVFRRGYKFIREALIDVPRERQPNPDRQGAIYAGLRRAIVATKFLRALASVPAVAARIASDPLLLRDLVRLSHISVLRLSNPRMTPDLAFKTVNNVGDQLLIAGLSGYQKPGCYTRYLLDKDEEKHLELLWNLEENGRPLALSDTTGLIVAPLLFATSMLQPELIEKYSDKEWPVPAAVVNNLKDISRVLRSGPLTADACDHCGTRQGADGTELRRCSVCRVARYCGKECQTRAWRAGHKADCFDAGKLTYLAY